MLDEGHEPPPAGRVARRQDRTRKQLTSTARRLIAERGVAALTIGELTEATDIGRGSFYSYFSSKEELVEAVLNDGLETLATFAVAAIVEHEDPAVQASVANRRFFRMAQAEPEFASLLVQTHDGGQLMLNSTLPYTRSILQPGLDSGRFAVPDLDLALRALIASSFALLRSLLAGESAPDAAESQSELILRMFGISCEEAHAISRLPLD